METATMNQIEHAFGADAGGAETDRLRSAVRRSLLMRTGLMAAGMGLGIAPIAAATQFPPVFPLQHLLPGAGGDGSAGFVMYGSKAEDQSGASVSAAGDVNGDGLDDVIIGAWSASPNGRYAAGQTYVLFGRTTRFPAAFDLAGLLPAGGGDGTEGFVVDGIQAGDDSGIVVSGAGDVNGDGIDDIIIGADWASPGGRDLAGESFVVFGRDTARSGAFPPVVQLATLLPTRGGNGSDGFVLTGIGPVDTSGFPVSAAGDVNGDGIDDLIIGGANADAPRRERAGQSYVVFGRDTARTGNFPAVFPLATLLPAGGGDGSAGFVINGVHSFDLSGVAATTAGDINGDGIGDLVIGATAADALGRESAGQTFVVFGRNTAQTGNFPAVFPLATLLPAGGGDGSLGFVLYGLDEEDVSGNFASAAGDLNGDGIDDLIIAAPWAGPAGQPYSGQCYVVFGRNTAQTGNFPALLPLASLLPGAGGDGSTGFVLDGVRPGDEAGRRVSNAGDVNDDGLDDVIVGAYRADVGDIREAGASYVVFGRNTTRSGDFPAVFPLANLLPGQGGDGSSGFVLNGIHRGDHSGNGVSAAGDLNGDGIADLIIGAPGADPHGLSFAGESYVVFGRAAR